MEPNKKPRKPIADKDLVPKLREAWTFLKVMHDSIEACWPAGNARAARLAGVESAQHTIADAAEFIKRTLPAAQPKPNGANHAQG